MENQETKIKVKIAELRQKYAKLALNCRAAGIRVNSATVQEYARELQTLQAQLN
ncbi:MAG: hypothetical protein AABX07_03425 [Nanoarchaeota archaeon]